MNNTAMRRAFRDQFATLIFTLPPPPAQTCRGPEADAPTKLCPDMAASMDEREGK